MLSVVLGRTTKIYGPGEIFSGDVVINANTQCKILDLSVNYCGISLVSFVISVGENKARTCKKVEEEDTHLDVLHPLIRSYRGVEIETGVHTYPFSLMLPQLLPSSYRSPYGQVIYYVHIHLQTSVCTHDVRKPFVVLAPVNINLFPLSENPQSAEVAKKCSLISNKTLRLKASIPKTSFVPGDVIPVFVEVSNETRKSVCYLFCTLKQTTNVLVHLQEETVNRVTKQCITTIAHKLIDGRGHYSWLCQLPSSSLLPPTIAASTIVFVTYSIQVSAKIKQVSIPPEVQIPIIFGTRTPPIQSRSIHLQSTDTNLSRHDSLQSLPTATNPRRRITVTNQPPLTASKPRRRVTVSSQPQFNFADSTRGFSTHLQSIASDLTQHLSNQLQSSFAHPIRRFSYFPQTSSKA